MSVVGTRYYYTNSNFPILLQIYVGGFICLDEDGMWKPQDLSLDLSGHPSGFEYESKP